MKGCNMKARMQQGYNAYCQKRNPIHWEPGEREALIAKEIEAGRVTKCPPVMGNFYTQVLDLKEQIEMRQTSLRSFGGRIRGVS